MAVVHAAPQKTKKNNAPTIRLRGSLRANTTGSSFINPRWVRIQTRVTQNSSKGQASQMI
ncbi:hypothetical protein D3C86_2093250 [compost metagenome]